MPEGLLSGQEVRADSRQRQVEAQADYNRDDRILITRPYLSLFQYPGIRVGAEALRPQNRARRLTQRDRVTQRHENLIQHGVKHDQ